VSGMPGIYETGADMWREYKEQYGVIEDIEL